MTLNKKRVMKQVSKVLKIDLPRSGPLMKDDINAVLADGWMIVASYYDSSRDEVRFICTRPGSMTRPGNTLKKPLRSIRTWLPRITIIHGDFFCGAISRKPLKNIYWLGNTILSMPVIPHCSEHCIVLMASMKRP